MRIITTTRCMLRPWQPEDAAALFSYARDPEVGPMAGWPPHRTLAQSQWAIRRYQNSIDSWAVIFLEDSALIGAVTLQEDRRRPAGRSTVRSLGFSLSRVYWGRGLMPECCQAVLTYAFHELGLSLVSANCLPENTRSRRVLEKLGFVYEGSLRQAFRHADGNLADNLCFSITAQEFSAHLELQAQFFASNP